jgi:hypothetical protein
LGLGFEDKDEASSESVKIESQKLKKGAYYLSEVGLKSKN